MKRLLSIAFCLLWFSSLALAQNNQPADASSNAPASRNETAGRDGSGQQPGTSLDFTDPESWKKDLMPLALNLGKSALGALLVLIVACIFAGIVSGIVTRSLRKAKIDETLIRFFARLAHWLVLVLGVLACLSLFGIETTSFAAVIGSAGLAIGLALQGTLGNFASGVMLLIFRPFRVGHVVKVSGHTGKIFAIDLFTTSLDTFDNRRIIIPNGSVFDSTIENVTHHPHRRAEVDVGVTYGADIDRTREVLTEAAFSVPNRLEDPQPDVFLLDLGASSVNWQVRVWARNEDFANVKQGTIRAVKMALDQAGIEIPFPQMDVHLEKQS